MRAFEYVKIRVMNTLSKLCIIYEIKKSDEWIEKKSNEILKGYEFNDKYFEDIKRTCEKFGVESVLIRVKLRDIVLGYETDCDELD